MSDIRTILFDLDDTLLDFADYWKDSLIETFRRHPSTYGLDPDQLFERLWAMNEVFEKRYHAREITLRDFRNSRFIHAMRQFDRDIADDVADDFNALHKSVSKLFMKASPDLRELLARLGKTYTLGIVTNGTAEWQYDKLEALGIKALFAEEAIVISEEVGCEKPAPEIYAEALARTRSAPEETLFVGDSWMNDVVGPMRAGMKAVWVNKTSAQSGASLRSGFIAGSPEMHKKNGLGLPAEPKPYRVVASVLELRSFL